MHEPPPLPPPAIARANFVRRARGAKRAEPRIFSKIGQPTYEGGNHVTDQWYEQPYKGAPMIALPGFPRPLYPPDAAQHGKRPSVDGPDVEAYKRTVWRLGRWSGPASNFDRAFSNNFSHGRGPNVIDSGLAGVQRQAKLDDTGWVGEKTFNLLRSVLIPVGFDGPGEPGDYAMDAYAQNLLIEAYNTFGGHEPTPTPPTPSPTPPPPREIALDHMHARLGYTESPPNSNCDSRADGIRTAQDHCANGTWLRGEPWCGCWCYYALEAAGVEKIDSHLASVSQIEDYARQSAKCYRGWTTDRSKVKVGDLAVIGGYGVHVEMVRAVPTSSSTLTYGGNTSPGTSGSQSNGGGAYARTRYPSEVRGYALVRYPNE